MSDITLARRAVACKGWEWPDTGGLPSIGLRGGHYYPDLDDPRCRGQLLALVRKAWGAPLSAVAWSNSAGCWTVSIVGVEGNSQGALTTAWFDGPTEAAALVAALEAAP